MDRDARPPARGRHRPTRGAAARRAARAGRERGRAPIRPASAEDEAWLGFERERVQAALCARCRTRSARRSSSPTTAATRSPSWPSGSECRSGRSRAGCSPGSRGCGRCSTKPNQRDHGRRDSRADRGLRARRPRRGGSRTRQGAPRDLRGGARGAPRVHRRRRRAGDSRCRARPARPSCATGSSTRRAPSLRTSSRSTPRRRSRACPCSAPPRRSPRAPRVAVGVWGLAGVVRPRRRTRRRSSASAPPRPCSPTRLGQSTLDRQQRAARRRRRRPAVLVLDEHARRARRARRTRCGSSTADTPVSGGPLRRPASGRVAIPVDGRVAAGSVVAVTVEDDGGADAPSGEPGDRVRAQSRSRSPTAARSRHEARRPHPYTRSGAGTDLRPALRELFGFDEFRPGQEAVVRAAVEGTTRSP